jgi:PAS domain S-box-containing protein
MLGAALSAGVEFGLALALNAPVTVMHWLRLWTAYSLAGILVAPMVISLFGRHGKLLLQESERRYEALTLGLTLLAVAHLVFSVRLPLVYLLLPFLVWDAVRFAMATMTMGLGVVAVIGLHHSAAGMGPYAGPLYSPEVSEILVQSFLMFAAFGGLMLSAVIGQWRATTQALQASREELESRVAARTAELAASERQLREAEERFRLARGGARMTVLSWEIDADVLTFSDSPEWLRGPLPPDGRYPNYKDQVHPEDRAYFLEMRDRAIRTMQGQTVEFRVIRTDGVIVHIASHQTMIAGADGKAAWLLAVQQDITARRMAEMALRESELRLRALLDAMPDEVRLMDMDRRYVMLNRAARDSLGRPEKEIIGRTIHELCPEDRARVIDALDRQAFETGRPVKIERRSYIDADSWRELINYPIRDAADRITGLVSIERDITERKKAELDALREREERYRSLVEQAGDLICRTDARGHFTYANSTAVADMLGYAQEEVIGRQFLEFVRADFRDTARAFYARQFIERLPATYQEVPVIAKDGRTVWVGQRVQMVARDGRVLHYQAVGRDITERVAAQQALRDFNVKLRQLSARQADVLEAERMRIAHDLHDSVGQSLNLARIRLETLAGTADHPPDATGDVLREVLQVLAQSSAVIRTLEFDLSPPVLRELGLEPALEWLAEELHRTYDLKVSLSSDGEEKPLSQTRRAVAFRTVRELLINVAKHAGTLHAHVDTQVDGGRVKITVSDEGSGFDPEGTPRGLGLTSVHERMTHVGGSATIRAVRGEGAVVSLTLPLESPQGTGGSE